MKKIENYHYRLLTALIATLLSLSSFAQGSRLDKSYKWEYQAGPGKTIAIENYDCDIVIHTWERAEVKYELSVVAEMNSAHEAELLDSFLKNLSFKNNSSRVDLSNRFWTKRVTLLNRKTITLPNNEKLLYSEMNLSAEVWLPADATLEIESKYSGITMDEMTGNTRLSLYSDKLNGTGCGNIDIEAKYSNIELGNTGTLKAVLYDSNLSTGNSKNIFIDSKYSTVTGINAGDLIIDSYDDKISFESSQNTGFTSKYSDLKIGTTSDLILDTYNGSVTTKSSNLVRITGKYSTYKMGNSTGCTILSAYDSKITFDDLATIRVDESKYTTYIINQLGNSFRLLSGYDDNIKISSVATSFSLFSANGKYVKSSINIPETMNCLVKADAKYAKIDIDENLFKSKINIVESSNTRLEALKGEEKKGMPRIEVTGYNISLSVIND